MAGGNDIRLIKEGVIALSPEEQRIAEYLHANGLIPVRFTDAERALLGETPDFKVYKGSELIAYCEVKTLVETIPTDWITGDESEEELIMAAEKGVHTDTTVNRVQRHMEKALSQFESVNADRRCLNWLAYVSHEVTTDLLDVAAVLTGCLVTEKGERHYIYGKHADGRIKHTKWNIDLWLWFGKGDQHPFFIFNMNDDRRVERSTAPFGLSRDDIMPL